MKTTTRNALIGAAVGLTASCFYLQSARADEPVWDYIVTYSYDQGYQDGMLGRKNMMKKGSAIDRLAKSLNVEVEKLGALVEVEAKHRNRVPTNKIPVRYERHVMFKCLKKAGKKHWGYSTDLVWSKRDKRKHYAKSVYSKKTGKLLHADDYSYIARASKINAECAHRATSWSEFQVMGYNHSMAGYGSAVEMAKALHENPDAKYRVLAGFLENHKAGQALTYMQKGQWEKFARSYNGKNWKRNKYATKISLAYNELKEKN